MDREYTTPQNNSQLQLEITREQLHDVSLLHETSSNDDKHMHTLGGSPITCNILPYVTRAVNHVLV